MITDRQLAYYTRKIRICIWWWLNLGGDVGYVDNNACVKKKKKKISVVDN